MAKNRRKYRSRSGPAGKHKGKLLEIGMKGFLCTCNQRIRECIREAYNLLNEYAEKMNLVKEEVVTGERIEDELERELKGLQQKRNEKKYLFQCVDTGADNIVFIKTEVDTIDQSLDPVKAASDIISEIYTTKKAKSRFLLRMVPIEVVCKAYIDDIRKAADQMFDKPFKCDPLTFNVFYTSRNNSSVLREEVLSAMVTLVRDRNPDHKVDLTSPRKTVIVDVIKGVCCLSVVSDFYKYRKYNLLEAAKGGPSHAAGIAHKVTSAVEPSASKESASELNQIDGDEPEAKRAKMSEKNDPGESLGGSTASGTNKTPVSVDGNDKTLT